MKNLIFFTILLFAFTSAGAADKACECGSHALGITTFTVSSGGCCDGAAGALGVQYTYTYEGGDVWSVASTTTITGTAAQNECCDAV